jgi:alpha-glucosidase
VPVAANGGFVSVICAYRSGASTCDRPLRRVPPTSFTLTPAQAEVRPGGTVEVTGTFTLPSGGPLTGVELRAAPGTGWTASGGPVRRDRLRGGESISGTWRFTVTGDVRRVAAELPVVATYRFPEDPARLSVHVEEAVRVLIAPAGPAYVSDLPFLSETNGWGPVERDMSNGEAARGDGTTLSIGGTAYAKGAGMHAPGAIGVWLGGACTRFQADMGIDGEVTQPGSAAFGVLGDDRPLADSGPVRSVDGTKPLDVDVRGVRVLTLRVTDGGDGKNYDHADWGGARVTCS